jgi:hypothetical protein
MGRPLLLHILNWVRTSMGRPLLLLILFATLAATGYEGLYSLRTSMGRPLLSPILFATRAELGIESLPHARHASPFWCNRTRSNLCHAIFSPSLLLFCTRIITPYQHENFSIPAVLLQWFRRLDPETHPHTHWGLFPSHFRYHYSHRWYLTAMPNPTLNLANNIHTECHASLGGSPFS